MFTYEKDGEIFLIRPLASQEAVMEYIHEDMASAKRYCLVGGGYPENDFFNTAVEDERFHKLPEREQIYRYIKFAASEAKLQQALCNYFGFTEKWSEKLIFPLKDIF